MSTWNKSDAKTMLTFETLRQSQPAQEMGRRVFLSKFNPKICGRTTVHESSMTSFVLSFVRARVRVCLRACVQVFYPLSLFL